MNNKKEPIKIKSFLISTTKKDDKTPHHKRGLQMYEKNMHLHQRRGRYVFGYRE
jgi:hypothetical protein